MTENEKLLLEAQRASERRDTLRMLTAADELLRRDPNNVDAMFIAGTAMLISGQEGTAALMLNAARCATKDPGKLGPIWDNLGCALQEYQPEEAYKAFRKSLEYGAGPATHDNLCAVSSSIGRHAEALEWAEKSDAFDPSHNRSFALLHLGRWEEAWKSYAKGAGTAARPRTDRTYDLPRWDGKKSGKVIIHGEQGVGDEIMFMSMCPADFDGVIECSPRMEGLFQRSFPKARVYGTLLNNYLEWPLHERADYHIEMGGLGEYFAAEPFARGGFLAADAARCAGWRAWLGECLLERSREGRRNLRGAEAQHSGRSGGGGSRGIENGAQNALGMHGVAHVGISWTGGTWSTGRATRTIPFELFREKLIKQHPDVTFVCLEYEDRKDELSAHPEVLNPYWATKKGADMDDLAALVASLDLVISATNSTVDVAGALGVPTWALVPHNPPWRYSETAGENEMWFYESVRTFRKRADEDWTRVMSNVTTALHQMKLKAAA